MPKFQDSRGIRDLRAVPASAMALRGAGNRPARWDTTFAELLGAVRLGLSQISGMREAVAQRIMVERQQGPFQSVEEFDRRAGLDTHDLRCLSGADALRTLAGHRPNAVWQATGVETRPTGVLRDAPKIEEALEFSEPTEAADVVDDYAPMALTLRRHRMALLRRKLATWNIRTAEDLRSNARDQDTVRTSGIVARDSQHQPADRLDHSGEPVRRPNVHSFRGCLRRDCRAPDQVLTALPAGCPQEMVAMSSDAVFCLLSLHIGLLGLAPRRGPAARPASPRREPPGFQARGPDAPPDQPQRRRARRCCATHLAAVGRSRRVGAFSRLRCLSSTAAAVRERSS